MVAKTFDVERRIKAISEVLKKKIIIQTIDQIDELLSKSDQVEINAIIAKFKRTKQRENKAETTLSNEESEDESEQLEKESEESVLNAIEPAEEDKQIDKITIVRNKSSGKYFIYLEGVRDGNDTVINPIGKKIPFNIDLFEDPEDMVLETLLSENMINEAQINEYKKQKKFEGYHDDIRFQEKLAEIILPPKTQTLSVKTPTPSAFRWANNVPELSDKNFKNWKEICDFLGLDVSGDSARRVLKRWVTNKKPDWPNVPGLDSDYA